MPVCSANVSHSRSRAATSPKSSRAFGRSSTARRRTSCKRLDHLLANRRERLRPLGVGAGLLDRLQPEQHRRQLLAGLVVQLAREPAPLELLGLDDPSECVPGHPGGQVDGNRRARRERLRQAQVVVREAWIAASLSWATMTPIVRPPATSGTYSPLVAPSRAAASASTSGSSASRSTRSARPRSSTRPLFDPFRSRSMPTISAAWSPAGCLDAERSVCRRQRDRDEAGVDQAADAACDEVQQRCELDLAGERRSHLVERLELLGPRRRRLVQAGVLDRHGRLARQRLDELLIARRERARAPLREVEVAEGAPAQQDRHPEEAAHRRVVRREADRARVVGDRFETERARVADQGAEDAPPLRELPDPVHRLFVDAGVHEALELGPGLVDDSERRIPGLRQRGGGLDELLQQVVERQLGAEGDAGSDEPSQAVGLGHGAIIAARPRRLCGEVPNWNPCAARIGPASLRATVGAGTR